MNMSVKGEKTKNLASIISKCCKILQKVHTDELLDRANQNYPNSNNNHQTIWTICQLIEEVISTLIRIEL